VWRPARPGDLGELVGGELAHAVAVELGQAREGDMADVEVEAHADGVGGHEEVHVAVLVELDLGVAGAGDRRAHDHGRAAAGAADEFGDGVDVLDREADDGGALGHPADLLGPV
jgi:hypothetical protein